MAPALERRHSSCPQLTVPESLRGRALSGRRASGTAGQSPQVLALAERALWLRQRDHKQWCSEGWHRQRLRRGTSREGKRCRAPGGPSGGPGAEAWTSGQGAGPGAAWTRPPGAAAGGRSWPESTGGIGCTAPLGLGEGCAGECCPGGMSPDLHCGWPLWCPCGEQAPAGRAPHKGTVTRPSLWSGEGGWPGPWCPGAA